MTRQQQPVLLISNSKGFSLVEVMIALLLLLVGSLATLGGLNLSQVQQMRNLHTEEAKTIMRQLNNEIQTTLYNDITSLDATGSVNRIIGTKARRFSWTRDIQTATTSGVDDNEGIVIVTVVSWTIIDGGTAETLTNRTIRGDYE